MDILVSINGNTYPCAQLAPYRWNGFVTPLFTRTQAIAVKYGEGAGRIERSISHPGLYTVGDDWTWEVAQ